MPSADFRLMVRESGERAPPIAPAERVLSDLPIGNAPSAVDAQHLPRGKSRLIAHEVDRGAIKIRRLCDATAVERLFAADESKDGSIIRRAFRHRCFDKGGRNHVRAYIMRRIGCG